MIFNARDKVTKISDAQIKQAESQLAHIEKYIAEAGALIAARSGAESKTAQELFNGYLCETLDSLTFTAQMAEMAIRPAQYCGEPATEATPDAERNEEWRITIRDGEVSFARYDKHNKLVSYRPSSLTDAIEDAKAILQGFQPPPSRQRLDRLVQQIEPG
jgi:hypothetical protein